MKSEKTVIEGKGGLIKAVAVTIFNVEVLSAFRLLNRSILLA